MPLHANTAASSSFSLVRELDGVADAEARVDARCSGGLARLLDHRGGDVDALDPEAALGQRKCHAAVAAAQIEHRAARREKAVHERSLGDVQAGVGSVAQPILGALVVRAIRSARVVLVHHAAHAARLTGGRRMWLRMSRPPLSALPT